MAGILHDLGEALGLNKESRDEVEKIISDWPSRPKLGAQLMLEKYGAPNEASAEEIVWRSKGAYKKIIVTRTEHHHDFPKPHMDFLEHTISYRVPPDRAVALAEYDDSCTFDRTRGELKARCDLEGHNILTLSLAHDIILGKMTAEEARRAFSRPCVSAGENSRDGAVSITGSARSGGFEGAKRRNFRSSLFSGSRMLG